MKLKRLQFPSEIVTFQLLLKFSNFSPFHSKLSNLKLLNSSILRSALANYIFTNSYFQGEQQHWILLQHPNELYIHIHLRNLWVYKATQAMEQYHPSYCVRLRYKLLLLLGNENRRLCGEVFANIPSQKTRLRHLGWCGRGHLQTVIRCLVKDQFQSHVQLSQVNIGRSKL